MTTTSTPGDEERRRLNERLVRKLRQFETYSPSPFLEPPSNECMPPTSLFNFYDRHVAEHLRLKHLYLIPNLHRDLAAKVQDRLDELREIGLGVPKSEILDTGNCTPLHTSQDELGYEQPLGGFEPRHLSQRFRDLIGEFVAPYASHWVISPNAPYLQPHVTDFSTHGPQDHPNRAVDYPWKGVALHFRKYGQLGSRLLSCVDESTKEFLKTRASEDIMPCIFLPYSAESAGLLRDMDRVSTLQEFPSSSCATSGVSASNSQHIGITGVDALKAPWLAGAPRPEVVETAQEKVSSDLVVPSGGRPADFGKDGEITAEGLLHHVWRMAVLADATFVMIHCGDLERLGVRHRGTQTLYLSSLVEVSTTQNPSYAKLHLGLQMAALEDAQDRFRQVQSQNTSRGSTSIVALPDRKRKREDIDIFPASPSRRCSKRNWLKSASRTLSEDMDPSQPDMQELWTELNRCSIALVWVEDGILKSPNPASCLRVGGALSPHGAGPRFKTWKQSYKPIDTLKITLGRPLYRGAGKIHLATLEVKLKDGRVLTQHVMAKVATTPTDQALLHHEYAIYKHLWGHGVQGISCIFGLFEDFDNLATILVMERGGVSLLTRKPYDPNGTNAVEVSGKEKKTCLLSLAEMHQRGVLHGCIQPRHIIVGHEQKVTIIDFSQARLDATAEELQEETFVMEGLVDGYPTEEWE